MLYFIDRIIYKFFSKAFKNGFRFFRKIAMKKL